MRISIIGVGAVGSSVAFSLLQRGLPRELVLVDQDRSRAEGEAMDLMHALAFMKNARVRAGTLDDAAGTDLIVVTAGRASVPGETRLDLLRDNAARMRTICASLKAARANGILLVISNPVDVLTEIARRELGGAGRVLGTGTSLDTARLKALLGERLGVDPHSVDGYILGEHGDSEFPAWSTVRVGGVPIRDWPGLDAAGLDALFERVRTAAYEIIKRKKATYFAIGATAAIVSEALLRDQGSVLPVSVPIDGAYGLKDVSLSLPCCLGARGVLRVLQPPLDETERRALRRSADVLSAALGAGEDA